MDESDIEKMKAEGDVKGLLEALEYIDVYSDATEAIVEIGKPAVEPLIHALEDEDWLVRQEAAWALGKIGDTRAVDPLIQALKDKHEEVRQRAAMALGDIGDARAVGPLIQVLKDDEEDEDVRESAAGALGKMGEARAVELLTQALKDKEQHAGRSAKGALGERGKPFPESFVRGFIGTLKSEDRQTRWLAAEALGKQGDARAIEPLIQVLKDENWSVRGRAAESLDELGWRPRGDSEKVHYLIAKREWDAVAGLGQPAIEPLIQALRDKFYFVRRGAAEALGEIGDARAVEPLLETLKNKDYFVRREAAKALGRLDYAGASKPLAKVLKKLAKVMKKDKKKDVREAAEEALEKIKTKN